MTAEFSEAVEVLNFPVFVAHHHSEAFQPVIMLLLRFTVEAKNLFSSLDGELVVAPCFNMRLKKKGFMSQILEC